MNPFKPGDKVQINNHVFTPFPKPDTVLAIKGNFVVLENDIGNWCCFNLKLVTEEPKIKPEEWKPGWVVRNTDSNAEHTVSRVDTNGYWLRHKSDNEWFLPFDTAKQILGGDLKYTVVSREETLTELPCVKVIPPIPARKEIVSGELYPYSFFQVQSGSTSQVYIWMNSNGAWMSKDSLRKTAQAMNILANILEENSTSNNEIE